MSEHMPTQLLKTKLYIPPLRPELVSRPRLIERLDEGLRLGHKLTLVSAPAGFGKTTLLSAWTSHAPLPTPHSPKIAWLALDEGDNDPIQFLTYLVGALQTVDEEIGQAVRGLLQAPRPLSAAPGQASWVHAPTAMLINDVATVGVPLTLVLDDYHLISSAPVHQAMRFLIERQPPSLHIVIVVHQYIVPELTSKPSIHRSAH